MKRKKVSSALCLIVRNNQLDTLMPRDSRAYDLTFFVPCYNEEGNIELTINTIQEAMEGLPLRYEILVCDDASTDKTKRVVETIMREKKAIPFRLVSNKKNKGLGFNYFHLSLLARGKHYMLVNGDNVEPAEAIRRIVRYCGKCDMVIPYFGPQDRRSFFRVTTSRIFSLLVNLASGNNLHYYNGPVLHRTENVRIWRSETRGYGYQAELICRLLHEGASYREVIVPNANREWGFSKAFSLGNILSVSNSLFHIFLRRLEYASFFLLTPKTRVKKRKTKK